MVHRCTAESYPWTLIVPPFWYFPLNLVDLLFGLKSVGFWILIALAFYQTNIAPSPIPLAPQHPVEEDEDSNNDVVLEVEDGEETESDVVLPRSTAEQRSKGNQDRDTAREGATRGSK